MLIVVFPSIYPTLATQMKVKSSPLQKIFPRRENVISLPYICSLFILMYFLLCPYFGQGENNGLSVFLKVRVKEEVGTFSWIELMTLCFLSHKTLLQSPLESSESLSLVPSCSFLNILNRTIRNDICLSIFDLQNWKFRMIQINTYWLDGKKHT